MTVPFIIAINVTLSCNALITKRTNEKIFPISQSLFADDARRPSLAQPRGMLTKEPREEDRELHLQVREERIYVVLRGRSSSVDSLVSREKGVEGSRIVDHARSLKAFVDYRPRRDFN